MRSICLKVGCLFHNFFEFVVEHYAMLKQSWGWNLPLWFTKMFDKTINNFFKLSLGQDKSIPWEKTKKIDKQEIWQWTSIKQIYYLNKTWCMLAWNGIGVQRSQFVFVRLKDGTFQTFFYTIQWNFLEYHINLLTFFPMNPSLSFY